MGYFSGLIFFACLFFSVFLLPHSHLSNILVNYLIYLKIVKKVFAFSPLAADTDVAYALHVHFKIVLLALLHLYNFKIFMCICL